MKHTILKFIFGVAALIGATTTMAQNTAAAATEAAPSGGVDINIILLLVAIFLLVPILVLSKTFTTAINFYAKKRRNSAGTIGATIFLVLLSQMAYAQDAAATAVAKPAGMGVLTIVLLVVILLEILVILFFSNLTVKYVKDPAISGVAEGSVKEKSALQGLWEKINSFKPIEEEAKLDTGHSYDGIRELNNTLPPWFTVTFLGTIIFAVIYLWRYHVAEKAPLQEQEYKNEVSKAQKEVDAYLKATGGGVDENNVKLLTGADIEAGKKLFITNCAACHKPDGGGLVGPNLTDEYWIHGGAVNDIFKTIKYGYPDKGMQSWKSNFSGTEMAQLASFVKSIKGTNPPGAKEKQGDLYMEKAAAKDTTATKVTDTTAKAK